MSDFSAMPNGADSGINDKSIFEIQGLKKYFPVKSAKLISSEKLFVKAVDGINLKIGYGETLAVVGESGCGKTTLGRVMIKLLAPTEGRIFFEGQEITHLKSKEMNPYRKSIQIMFQDPYASLNPRMTVADIIAEPLDIMRAYKTKAERLQRIVEMMEVCGINKTFLNRYPHEFSGGQRQRIGIARALSINPRIIICDEPVSALDVSIQSQIINLLMDLRQQYKLTMVFISHDLGVVKYISNRVMVMYLGKAAELGPTGELFKNPLHPYTRVLLDSMPVIGGNKFESEKENFEGDPPSPVNPPAGCSFHTRCPEAMPECQREIPVIREAAPGRFVACHRVACPAGKGA